MATDLIAQSRSEHEQEYLELVALRAENARLLRLLTHFVEQTDVQHPGCQVGVGVYLEAHEVVMAHAKASARAALKEGV